MFKHRYACMSLENEIKQTKPFKNPYEKLGVNLLYTSSWLGSQLKEHFAAFSITPKQYNILRILLGAGKPVSTNFIRERLLDKMSDVSRIVDRLSAEGWVEKRACQTDKRLPFPPMNASPPVQNPFDIGPLILARCELSNCNNCKEGSISHVRRK